MSDAARREDAKPTSDSASTERRLVCPHCKASYRSHRPTEGRRVRCPHCDHVWRDDAGAVGNVAGALGEAAAAWARLGSTLVTGETDATSVGELARQLARPAEVAASEWIGKTLGRYRVKAILGEGAMGYVYEARDTDLNRVVALKVLPRRAVPGHESLGLKMFLQEAKIAAKLQHPNIVTVYEVGVQGDVHFFAMECVVGTTLARLISDHGPLPAKQVCYLIARAARALAAGHALGIVHRDVKPGNIMIDTAGHVKVTDFGLADVAGIEGVSELSERPLGSPGWISPEVARGERASPASDIYGLGLTLYYCMTGDRLIKADTKSGMLRLQREAKSAERNRLPRNWPPRLRDITVQCLQANAQDRYQSGEMLSADLLSALRPSETDVTVILGNSAERQPKLAPPLLSYAALAVLLAVATALAVWWWLLR
ncbi:MAG: protein kinase [Planctomycetota bacterium]